MARPIRLAALAALLLLTPGVGGAGMAAEVDRRQNFRYNLSPPMRGLFLSRPTFAGFTLCYTTGCRQSATVAWPPQTQHRLRALLPLPGKDPQEEREGIAAALGILEYHLGHLAEVDLWDDQARDGMGGRSNQADCVDESHNALSLLLVLSNEGLLRFHRPIERVRRSHLLLQHFGVLIRDQGTGEEYVVDTWSRPNGHPALVQRLDDWMARRESPQLNAALDRLHRENLRRLGIHSPSESPPAPLAARVIPNPSSHEFFDP